MTISKAAKHVSAFLGLTALLAAVFLWVIRLPAALGSQDYPRAAVSSHRYSILIDLDESTLTLLDDGKTVRQYPCAIGKADTPSPIGYFHITRKSRWGEGFGGYFLGLDVPWGIYGIHGTTQPDSVGFPASHGCFRLLDADIRELYATVSRGTPVLVISGVYGAFGRQFRMISPGMYGQDVLLIQKTLQRLGYYSGKCTGRYDTDDFRQAIRRFQRDYGLPQSDSISRRMAAAMGLSVIE